MFKPQNIEQQYYKSIEKDTCPLCNASSVLLITEGSATHNKVLCGGCTAVFQVEPGSATHIGFDESAPNLNFFKPSVRAYEV